VGVNAGPDTEDRVLERMGNVTDFMAYDIMKGKAVGSPSAFEEVVQRLIRLSRGQEIALQNAGWSTSATDRSSDEEQVEFIRRFYRVLYRYRDKIEYASFGSLYDHDQSITGPAYRAAFPDYPAAFVDKIVDSMSHFGVFRHDGTPKPGWNELKEQVATYYRRQWSDCPKAALHTLGDNLTRVRISLHDEKSDHPPSVSPISSVMSIRW